MSKLMLGSDLRLHKFGISILINIFCFTVTYGTAGYKGENKAVTSVDSISAIEDVRALDTTQTFSESSNAEILENKIRMEGRIRNTFDPSIPIDLPIGILPGNIPGDAFLISIDSLSFSTKGATVSAYMSAGIPKTNKRLNFHGKDISLSPAGFTGDARLELVKDEKFSIMSNLDFTILAEEHKTFVEWDCNGFKDMGLQGKVAIAHSAFIAVNKKGQEIPGKKPEAIFETQITGWNDLILSISLEPFGLKNLSGFVFSVSNATFDFSDTKNPIDIQFPTGYTSNSMAYLNCPLWQGIYLKDLSIQLPEQFSGRGKPAVSFAAHDLIIDDAGLTGELSANNLISIAGGNISGWSYSLDKLQVGLFKNQIEQCNFNGKITLPIQKEGTSLDYAGFIDYAGNYFFHVITDEGIKIQVPALCSEMTIGPGSSLEVKTVNGEFEPKAILNGNIAIKSGQDLDLSIAELQFEEMVLQTHEPYFDVKSFTLTSGKQLSLANFPITLKNILVYKRDSEVGLGFDIGVNLMESVAGGFTANTSLRLVGEQYLDGNKTKYRFKALEIDSLNLNVNNGSYSLAGYLKIYRDDPTFGRGFKGEIKATLPCKISVDASAQFGYTENIGRYWYADALVTFKPGLMIFPGIGIYGFGGGIYHKMRQQLPTSPSASATVGSSSGALYIPDATIYLGVKASVVVGCFPSPTLFNGKVTLEAAFNKNGGLDYVGFKGDAYFMHDLEKPSTTSSVYGSLALDYDIRNSTLSGKLDAYVNLAGIMRGIHPGNRAGTALMFFSPSEWYVYIGTPNDRIGLEMMGVFKTESYLLAGTQIPSMPQLPSAVQDIIGELNFMREENLLKGGGGFAFGSRLDLSIPEIKFLMFYGKFDVGAGFDIMLKNYGSGVHCEGKTSALGINGWYASGQAYAYIAGKIGVKVRLRFYKGNFDILAIQAAVALQAKLPNPTWMQGTVGGNYSVLGGLVRGSCRFQLTIGEQCNIVGTKPMVDMQIISQITPTKGEKDINVFTAPQAIFNMAVNKEILAKDINGSQKRYQIVLDYFKVMDGNVEIPGQLQWNYNHDVVAFKSHDIFPGEKQLKATVQVSFKEWVDGNWKIVVDSGKIVTESMETMFLTGKAPDFIVPSNVKYSYPINNQVNFYKDEYGKGYIQLIQGQKEVFDAKSGWKYLGRIKGNGESIREFDIHYDVENKAVRFDLPSGMGNDKIYALELLRIPVDEMKPVDKNVSKKETTEKIAEGSEISVQTNEAKGTIEYNQEKQLYNLNFRTSRFGKFEDKIRTLSVTGMWGKRIYNLVYTLGVNFTSEELFDKYEIEGSTGSKPLVQMIACTNNHWNGKEIYPLLYEGYPWHPDVSLKWRIGDTYGIPPVKNVNSISQDQNDKILSESEIQNSLLQLFNGKTTFLDDRSFVSYQDYLDLLSSSAANYLTIKDDRLNTLLNNVYPDIFLSKNKIKVEVRYYLPGQDQYTSSVIVDILNL
jgi:hypothetical protein